MAKGTSCWKIWPFVNSQALILQCHAGENSKRAFTLITRQRIASKTRRQAI